MHEFAIGEQLVAAVRSELAALHPPPRRLLRVRVVAGRFRQIAPESLCLAYDLLTRDTPLAGSALELTQPPVHLTCRACGQEAEADSPVPLCPACGSAEVDVRGGLELYLDSLEVEPDERDHDPSLP